jgi:hypothetical protein
MHYPRATTIAAGPHYYSTPHIGTLIISAAFVEAGNVGNPAQGCARYGTGSTHHQRRAGRFPSSPAANSRSSTSSPPGSAEIGERLHLPALSSAFVE